MEKTTRRTWFSKCIAILRGGVSDRHAKEVQETARDRSARVQEQIVEHRMQERARKGINVFGGVLLPESWDIRTLGDLRRVYMLSRTREGADKLSDSEWGLLHQAEKVFSGEDTHAFSSEDLDALAGLAFESETADVLSLRTLFERMQTRNEHLEHLRVQTIKAKGHL